MGFFFSSGIRKHPPGASWNLGFFFTQYSRIRSSKDHVTPGSHQSNPVSDIVLLRFTNKKVYFFLDPTQPPIPPSHFSHHVGPLERYRNSCSESCYPLYCWFLDLTTRWRASGQIHPDATLQVSFFCLYHPKGVFFFFFYYSDSHLTSCRWFHAHWVIQFLVAGPVIFAGWALGHQSSEILAQGHYLDVHQKVGLALLILYVLQLAIGVFVHAFKFPSIFRGHRAPHNYFHVVFGLAIFALAQFNVCVVLNNSPPPPPSEPLPFWLFSIQVYYGLFTEWDLQVGSLHPVPQSAKHAWLALVIVSYPSHLGHRTFFFPQG